MADNVLKKEFKEKDVQRLRNLMTGKYGEKNTVVTGYTKQKEFHEQNKENLLEKIKKNIMKLIKINLKKIMKLIKKIY
jgi:RNase H-fold protein (predicted Holliday junction resolvase)